MYWSFNNCVLVQTWRRGNEPPDNGKTIQNQRNSKGSWRISTAKVIKNTDNSFFSSKLGAVFFVNIVLTYTNIVYLLVSSTKCDLWI